MSIIISEDKTRARVTPSGITIVSKPVTDAGLPASVQYLVVAGGGGTAGVYYGGGGGGGGVRTGNFNITPGVQIPVTVGAGGIGSSNGGNSALGGVVALGGGFGGAPWGGPGSNGGSGGGSSAGTDEAPASPGGNGVVGQGYSGGAGSLVGFTGEEESFMFVAGGGGGGGGAGGSGQNAPPFTYWLDGGNGGPGFVSSITGSSVSYGAGGGGGGDGLGGSGAGNGLNIGPSNAVSNRGGGAGADFSGVGGSGFVCIRYPNIHTLPSALTGTYTIQTVGTDIVIAFTASGSIVF